MKDKQWKDLWDVDLGVSYIPINRLDPQTDMAMLEDGGMFDEDTMPDWMKSMRGVAPSTMTTNNLGHGAPSIVLQPDQMQQVSPQQPPAALIQTQQPPTAVGIPPPFASVGIPAGLPPPFAIPGLPLPPPGPSPLLGPVGGPGLLPVPGSTGVPPANLLLGQPRFAGLAGALAGGLPPPPGFPGLDVSIPPPGSFGAAPPQVVQPQMDKIGQMDMDIEDKDGEDKRDKDGGSRWSGGRDHNREHRRRDDGHRDYHEKRDHRGGRENGGGRDNNNQLINRLRDLAGHSSAGTSQDHTREHEGQRSLLDMPEQHHSEGK